MLTQFDMDVYLKYLLVLVVVVGSKLLMSDLACMILWPLLHKFS